MGTGKTRKKYEVKDVDGVLVAIHEHVRNTKTDAKQCLWQQPNGEYGLNGARLEDFPLYGAHELDTDAMIVVVTEGEKARDALAEALADSPVSVVGTVTGAGGTPSLETLEVLRGHEVVAWPDADELGAGHMTRIAERLQGIAAAVRIYTWEDAPHKGDAANHPAVISGNEKALGCLLTNLCSAPEYTPPEPDPTPEETNSHPPTAAPTFNLTDLGNAERLVYHHGTDIRYCHPWSAWLVWDATRWIVDECAKVMMLAKETVRTIYGEAEAAANEGERKTVAQHAIRSESRQRLEAMLALAQSEPGIPVRPEELDPDPWLLNVENGTLDLRTGKLREHRRTDRITKLAPVEYDPGAAAPTWEAFLERVLPSEALRRFVQKVVGYSLTGDVSEQILLFMYGVGANGKSTFLNTVMEMLGDYAIQSAPDLLTVKQGAHPTELADLMGARFVASIEVEDGRRLAESLVKQMTGGDKIKARRMRQDFFQFSPTHKLFLAANHKPVVRGTDHAIWRRIKMIPFEVTIPKDEQDPKLTEKLRAELPGILAWAVRGCLDWQREGLGEPDEVKNATASYRADMDVLAQFIDECCFVGPNASVETTAFFGKFREWCAGANEHAGTQKALAARMEERGFGKGKHPSTRRALWKGIGLYTDHGPELPDGERSAPKPLGGPKPFEAFSGDNSRAKEYSSVYTEKPLRTPSTEAIPSQNGPEDPTEDYEAMVEERVRDVGAALDDGQWRDIL